jgi:predicted phosphoribosyltransferase
LAEGGDFLNKNISNELYLQQQIAEQTQKKLRSELSEVKKDFQNEQKMVSQKLRTIESDIVKGKRTIGT